MKKIISKMNAKMVKIVRSKKKLSKNRNWTKNSNSFRIIIIFVGLLLVYSYLICDIIFDTNLIVSIFFLLRTTPCFSTFFLLFLFFISFFFVALYLFIFFVCCVVFAINSDRTSREMPPINNKQMNLSTLENVYRPIGKWKLFWPHFYLN